MPGVGAKRSVPSKITPVGEGFAAKPILEGCGSFPIRYGCKAHAGENS